MTETTGGMKGLSTTPARTACILAVGDELLRGEITDTNSAFLAAGLTESGITVVENRSVRDDVEAIAGAVKELLPRAGLLLVSGGLGPTVDDCTRPGVAEALGVKISHVDEILDWMAERVNRPVEKLAKSNRRQCERVGDAKIIRNRWGTAPAQWIKREDRIIVLLPGVPRELKNLFSEDILPELRKLFPSGAAAALGRLACIGAGESTMADAVAEFSGIESLTIGTRVDDGVIFFRIIAAGENEAAARRRLEEFFPLIRKKLSTWVYAEEFISPAEALVRALKKKTWTVTLAESCTAGLVTHFIGQVSGASDVLKVAHVTYANEAKTRYAGVPAELLREHGAVSGPVVRAMAENLLEREGADVAIAVSGIAGPTGGTPEKPVGTVEMAVATREGTSHEKHRFTGQRTVVQRRAAHYALAMCLKVVAGQQGI